MRLLVALSAFVLVALSRADARPSNNRPSESFSYLASNFTASFLSQVENPTNLQINYYKIRGMDKAAAEYHIERPGGRVLTELGSVTRSMLIPERALASINEEQRYITNRIDRLEVEHAIYAPGSKIYNIIDEFRDKVADKASLSFEDQYAASVAATEKAEAIAGPLSQLLDELALKTDECLQLPAIAFRKIFQCNADSKRVVNRMTPDIMVLNKISEELSKNFFDQMGALDSEFATMLEEVERQIAELRNSEY